MCFCIIDSEFITITNGWNNREQTRLHQHFLFLSGVWVDSVTGIDHPGVVVVVGIVDADVPGADAVFLLLVEVHAEVEAVVVAHAEIVTFQGVDGGDIAPFVGKAFVDLGAERAAVAAAEDPCAAHVEAVVEFVLHGDAEVKTQAMNMS